MKLNFFSISSKSLLIFNLKTIKYEPLKPSTSINLKNNLDSTWEALLKTKCWKITWNGEMAKCVVLPSRRLSTFMPNATQQSVKIKCYKFWISWWELGWLIVCNRLEKKFSLPCTTTPWRCKTLNTTSSTLKSCATCSRLQKIIMKKFDISVFR